jgi:uncharacterized glyoxalase superfamily protein PhnB
LSVALTVKDLHASIAWYTDVLGLAIDQRHERNGQLVAASLKAGDGGILLNQDNGAKGAERIKGDGFSMQITTAQNVDEIARRIKAHGGTLDLEPTDMPHGARVFRVRDPDGFRLAISSAR